ncbi:MAG: putative ATPase, partial [Myxococcota bacterium]
TDLLAGQATDLDALGQTLVDALGPGVEVVARVSPAMGPLLGEFIARDSQRDPENSAARRRALQALFSLVTSLAHERPIALHIDDLQWADADTIELLEQLALSRGRHGLLLVLSWRSEEIGDGHRLRQLLQVLARRGDPAALCRVELSDLPLEAVSLMVADIIATPPPLVAPLAERLVALTHGNPFYVSRLMTEIHQHQFLWFDTSQRAWAWDLDAVSAIGAQANVVEWLSSRLGLLSPPGRRALSAAACTASAVSVDLIAAATGQGEAETLAGLMEPARLGFLTPIGSAQHRFRFVHDRVREAALQTLEPAERAVLHAAIGRTLLARWDGAGSIPFAAIDQLNRGVAEVRDPAERATLAQHNLEAARRARAAAGFGAAADYCEAGLALGAGDTALVSALRIELAELCRALRRLDRALELLVEAEREASDRTQRLEVLRLRVLVLIDGHRYDEALKAGVAAGALVDIHLPTDPGKGRVARELVAVKWALRGGALDDPMSLPRLNDPDIEVAMHALVIAGAGAYVMSPEFLAAVNLRVITLSVKHGRHPQLATAMMFYAVLLCGPLGDVPGGAAVGKAANALAGRADETSLRAAALFMYEAMVRHWAEPRGRTAARFEAVARVALETGQLDMAAFAHHMVLDDALLSGRPLSELEALCEETVGADLALNQIDKHHMNLRLWGLVRALLGWNEAPVLLEPRAASLAHYDQVAYPTGQAMVAAFDLMVAVYLRQHEEAVRAADELVRRSESITGSHWVGWGTVLGAIARLQHSGSTAVPAASKALKQVTRWARHNPTDYEHRRLLLAAELDRVAGRWAAADQGYEAAIARVAVHGWTPERALYLELAGRARIELGSARQGRADLREAVGLYARWGATAVIARLEDELGAFERRVSDIDESATRAESSLGSSNAVLDLGALALAGRALGSEIQLSAVLEELMGVALEVSGARRAVLVRLTDAGARVDAEARVEPAHLEVLQGVALPSSDPAGVACVSVRLVEYVRRTREPLALDEALRTGPLASDPWVARVRARSLLAQPLTHQGRMVGVLILENDLLPGAFPKRRLAVLNLLSVQMGSAIENAALYADLEQALTHQRQLTTAYSRFVPRQLLGLMGKADITEVALGDQVQREMTVLFSDIRDFSTITETMTPAEAFAFVNSFLSRMEPVIAQHGGFIDKYIGDAIMGLFEAPERAVAAAFGMLEA